MGFWIILLIIVVPLAYVRLAPSDPVRWHKAAKVAGAETIARPNAYIWRKTVDGDGIAELQALTEAATATERTTLLAGSVAEGQITFVTRSRVAGFPDYSTIGVYTLDEGTRVIEVNARLRFGKSDLGVNAKRVKGWVAAANL